MTLLTPPSGCRCDPPHPAVWLPVWSSSPRRLAVGVVLLTPPSGCRCGPPHPAVWLSVWSSSPRRLAVGVVLFTLPSGCRCGPPHRTQGRLAAAGTGPVQTGRHQPVSRTTIRDRQTAPITSDTLTQSPIYGDPHSAAGVTVPSLRKVPPTLATFRAFSTK